MKLISPEIAIKINQELIEKYSKGENTHVKDMGLLESAIYRPLQTAFGQPLYPEIFEKATALFESLAKNHPFENANKRTAFACMTYFLFINGHVCVMNEKAAADLTVNFVIGSVPFKDVVELIKRHSYRKTTYRSKPIV